MQSASELSLRGLVLACPWFLFQLLFRHILKEQSTFWSSCWVLSGALQVFTISIQVFIPVTRSITSSTSLSLEGSLHCISPQNRVFLAITVQQEADLRGLATHYVYRIQPVASDSYAAIPTEVGDSIGLDERKTNFNQVSCPLWYVSDFWCTSCLRKQPKPAPCLVTVFWYHCFCVSIGSY